MSARQRPGGGAAASSSGARRSPAPMEDPELARLRVRVIVGGAPLFLVLFLGLVATSPTPVRTIPAVLVALGITVVALAVGMQHVRHGPYPRGPAFWVGACGAVIVAGPLIAWLGPGPDTAFSVSQSFIVMAVVVLALEGRVRLVAGIGHAVAWLLAGWLLNDPSTDALLTGAIFQLGAVSVMLLAGQLFGGHVTVAAAAKDHARRADDEAELASAQERRRLAEALHDHALQLVLAAGQELDETPPHPSVDQAQEHLQAALKALRGLTVTMHDDRLTMLDPVTALEHVVAEASGDGRLAISLDVGSEVDPGHTVLLVESVRELLRNVRRHARARRAWVDVRVADGRLVVLVQDDGVGPDPDAVDTAIADGHLGLWRLHRRAAALGGRFSLQPRPDGGTCARLDVEDRLPDGTPAGPVPDAPQSAA